MNSNLVNRNKLTLRTNIQKALFLCELQGQFSDGMWENATPRNHWVDWCELGDANIEVGETIGRNFFPRRSTYGLTSKAMLDVIGDRMIVIAKLSRAFTPAQVDFLENYHVANGKWCENAAHFNPNSYYTKQRTKLFGEMSKWNLTKKVVDLCLVDETYAMKELKADLKEIKVAMETLLR